MEVPPGKTKQQMQKLTDYMPLLLDDNKVGIFPFGFLNFGKVSGTYRMDSAIEYYCYSTDQMQSIKLTRFKLARLLREMRFVSSTKCVRLQR